MTPPSGALMAAAGTSERLEPAAASTDLLVRFTGVAHDAGYPTADLEERVLALADALGVAGVQVSATPTNIEITFGALPLQRSVTLRVRPTAVDLDAIASLDDVVRDVIDGRDDADAALARLAEIEAHPLVRRWYVRLGAYALAGSAVTPMLGGGWADVVAGGVVGLLVGAVALPLQRGGRADPIVAPLAAVAASFCAASLARLGLKTSPDVVTLAALITFLPGMALAIGMRELATDNLQSGLANTASAVVQLLGLVFGVGIGRSIATNWFGVAHQTPGSTSFSSTHLIAAVAVGLAFTVTLRARFRAAPVMCAATVLAIIANAAGKALFGAAAGVFVAALAIGLVGAALSVRLRRSPLVFVVPGVLILVPGSAGFNSLLQLLTGQTVSGIETAINTFVTAMSIAYGLMLSSIVIPPRFTPFHPRGARSV